MMISPTARGMEVVPICSLCKPPANEGKRFPSRMPDTMAVKIQSVRYLSRKDNLLLVLFTVFHSFACYPEIILAHAAGRMVLWKPRNRQSRFEGHLRHFIGFRCEATRSMNGYLQQSGFSAQICSSFSFWEGRNANKSVRCGFSAKSRE
ncbi:hypothetical protein D3C75_840700 [compost metagenome]